MHGTISKGQTVNVCGIKTVLNSSHPIASMNKKRTDHLTLAWSLESLGFFNFLLIIPQLKKKNELN